MKKLFMFCLLVLLAVSCSTTKLSSGGKKVKIKHKVSKKCDAVGKVVGISEQGLAALAKNHARNLAAKMDANVIVLNEEIVNGKVVKIHATAYICQ